jgi:hypothetical protein
MWISTKHATLYNVTLASHRFNEIEQSIDHNLFTPSGSLSSYSINVLPGAVCFSLSSVHGDGLSILELSSQSIFSVVTRDKFGNLKTEVLENSVVSIIYDSSSKPFVTTSTFDALFREASVTLNSNIASGYCIHLLGSLISMFVLIMV